MAPERNVEFLHVVRAESLISQRLDRSLAYSYSHAGCSRWRWSDVTDTWDSSRAAGSRAPAERETNLNANQEHCNTTPRRARRVRKRISNERVRPIPIVFHVAVFAALSLSNSLSRNATHLGIERRSNWILTLRSRAGSYR